MFFNKKKPKIDPKVRFQNRQFNQKLHEARTFKRTARPITEGPLNKSLQRVGLGSRLKQIFFGMLFLGLVYVIYAPNFLSVQSVRVEGLSEFERIKAEAAIYDNLNNTPFYNPQRNLFFLSKNRVREVVSTISGVDVVESIYKNFKTKALTITVKPKHEKFLVRSSDAVFDVYNDGSLKSVAGVNRDAWMGIINPGMIKIDLGGMVNLQSDDSQEFKMFFSESTVEYITKLHESMKEITGSNLAYFSIRIPQLKEQQEFLELQKKKLEEATGEEQADGALQNTDDQSFDPEPEQQVEPLLPAVDVTVPINADELDIIFQKGTDSKRTFKVIVDTKEKPEQLVQRLNLLLLQTSPERYSQFFYIDLRVPSRAYVCLLNSPCIR